FLSYFSTPPPDEKKRSRAPVSAGAGPLPRGADAPGIPGAGRPTPDAHRVSSRRRIPVPHRDDRLVRFALTDDLQGDALADVLLPDGVDDVLGRLDFAAGHFRDDVARADARPVGRSVHFNLRHQHPVALVPELFLPGVVQIGKIDADVGRRFLRNRLVVFQVV